MSKLFVDDRRNSIQSGPKIPGQTTEINVNSAEPYEFVPTLDRPTLFEVKTTGDIRIAAHPASYTFVKATEHFMFAYEIEFFQLAPEGQGDASIITVVGATSSCTVYISPVAS
jgi:hypothetical protein